MSLQLIEHASLKPFNTFGVDARAAFLARITSIEQLEELESLPALAGLPRLILGGGSNLLFTADVDGVVIKIEIAGVRELEASGEHWRIEVGGGENWHATVERLLDEQRPGLENLALIPGQVGAAPIQNIGAYGVELAERFESLRLWDRRARRLTTMSLADCDFGYRDSVFKRGNGGERVIVSVTLALPRQWHPVTGYSDVTAELNARSIGRPDARDIFNAVVAIRRRKLPDPQVIGNAGSFFKNPIVGREKRHELIDRHPSLVSYAMPGGRFKLAAGWLIDAAGLKGATRGRAGVYEKQALVLVNRGGATGGEILSLAREVQDKVMEKFGVLLEPEPVIV